MAKHLDTSGVRYSDPHRHRHTPAFSQDALTEAMPLPGVEWVGIRTEALWGPQSFPVVALCGTPSPQVFHGGGFEDVARPLRRGVPRWRGTATPTLPLTLILDGLADAADGTGRSVEDDCRVIMRMAGGMVPDDPEPPELILWGAMLPAEAKARGARWVISEQPTWATDPEGVIRRDTDGRRVRQSVDLVFMRVGSDDTLEVAKGKRTQPRIRHVKARDGDTFEKIAGRELGSKRYARKLAELNGRGVHAVAVALKRNTDVKVPTGPLLAEWKRDLARKG